MEGEDPHRRQYDQSGYPSGRGFGQVPRGGGSDVIDRFRQPQNASARSPTSGPRSSAAGQSQGIAVYGYAQGQQQYAPQLQDTALQYPADFSQEPQRAQQYTQYPSNLMYNMPQQAPPQSPYDPVQQFQPRQTAAVEVLSNQFGVQQYYPTGDPTSAPGPMAQQYASAPFQQQIAYQQPTHAGRAALPTVYGTEMAEFVQPNVPDLLEQQEPAQDAGGYDSAYRRYVEKLRATFQDVKDGRLVEAGQCLLEISEFLLGQAVELGLTKDEEELHGERIKLWNDFNTCWLAVLQKQKDTTQEMIDLGQPPVPPQSYLQEDFLEKMGRELVRLCDGMERHGLVDYQMGVWEEEIISILIQCLDLLENLGGDENNGALAGSSAQPVARSHGSRNR